MQRIPTVFAGCLMIAALAATPAQASLSIDVTASVGPTGNDVKLSQEAGSPSADTFADRAVEYMETGSTTTGDPTLDPTAYQPITETTARGLVATPTFNSYRGEANPAAPFADEHGNMLYFSYHVIGDGSTQFRLVDLHYSVGSNSSEADDRFAFSGNFSDPQIDGYADRRIGINWGPDRAKGGGDDTRYTSDNGTTLVDEIVSVGVGVFDEPGTTGTEQQRLDNLLAAIDADAPFEITASYGIVTESGLADGSETVTVNAIPEPTSAALLGVGALGVLIRRRTRRRASPTCWETPN